MTEPITIHAFEAVGLGKAPFHVEGVVMRRGPIELRDGTLLGSSGDPKGKCHYCGRPIAECWQVRSADGRAFEVGAECVRRTGDVGLRRQAGPHLRSIRTAAMDVRIERARAMIHEPRIQDHLESRLHPIDYVAARGMSEFDFCLFLFHKGGRTRMLKAARMVEAAAESTREES